MLTVNEIIKQVEKVENTYNEEIYKKLDKPLEKIYILLKKELNRQCIEKKLVMSNSVYPELFPFTIIHRIKTPISLREKLIRNEKIFAIYNEDQRQIEQNIMNSIDDLIGFTILLDTSLYLEEIHQCLQDLVKNSSHLSIIKTSKNEIGHLEYYNLKLIYSEDDINLNFEVQIKSSMVSAFTNLEHKLMYKNNKIMISKENSQYMIKSVTPAILAAENVLDTALISIQTNKQQRENFERKDKIENLMRLESEERNIFSSYIEKLDDIIYRASKGYTSYNNNSTEEFWNKYKKEGSNLEIDNNNILISLLQNILNINDEFLENILFFEYNKYSEDEDLRSPFKNHMNLFNKGIEKDERIINSIYQESNKLKDIIQISADFANDCIDEIREFSQDSDAINTIEQKLFTLYFHFAHVERKMVSKKEVEDTVKDAIEDSQLEDYELDIVEIVMESLLNKSKSKGGL